jgi:Skp family chaperone for outer membrane proteins
VKLQAQINDQSTYLDNYRKVKNAWLQQQYANLISGPVLRDILDVVHFVAEAGGYSLILRSDSDAGRQLILYNVNEVDVTDQVIAEIYKRQGQPPSGGGQ